MSITLIAYPFLVACVLGDANKCQVCEFGLVLCIETVLSTLPVELVNVVLQRGSDVLPIQPQLEGLVEPVPIFESLPASTVGSSFLLTDLQAERDSLIAGCHAVKPAGPARIA